MYLSRAPPQHIDELSHIVVGHGGSVVSLEEEATHVVEWNDEVDSLLSEQPEDYIRIVEIRHDKTGICWIRMMLMIIRM